MIYNQMRKSNCQLCDGWGVVSVVINKADFARACHCKAGLAQEQEQKLERYKFNEKLKYQPEMELTEKEQVFKDRITRADKIVSVCPF